MSFSSLKTPLSRSEDSIPLNDLNPQGCQGSECGLTWSDGTVKDNGQPGEPLRDCENGGPQQATRTTTTRQRKQIIEDWWSEIFWVVFSAASLGTTAALLAVMDGKPLPSWRFSISLNAVVSALIVATKAALIYTTACCVGQLKWHHFQQHTPRSLYDLKTFDEASKGPLGALKLTARVRSISVVALLGSLVVLCAVFMETFGQQLLSYPTKDIARNGSLASFPMTHHLASQDSWYLDYIMMSDLQKLLLAAIFRGKTSPPFTCSTARCTWPASSTLGMCSSCRDITAASNGSCIGDSGLLQCRFMTPDGTEMGGSVEPGGPMPLINTTTVDGVYDVTPSFYNFSTLVVAEGTNWTAKLTTCELSWCAWTYESAVSEGTAMYLENPKQFPLNLTGAWNKENETLNLEDTQRVCIAMEDYPAGLNNTFTISDGKEYFLQYAVKLILKAGYQGADLYTQLTLATSTLDYTDTAAMAGNLAAFMTNALRTQDGMQSTGIAWQSTTFIKVQWAWLLLPGLEAVASMTLLWLTIAQSTRQQMIVWKSSLLAFLFCSDWQKERGVRVHVETRSLKCIERAAKAMEVRLVEDDEGNFRLVQV